MKFDDEALRRVLEAEAASVEVQPDALPKIRRRIAARRAWWSRRGGFMITFGSAAAAAATAAVVAFAGLGSCAPRREPAPNPPAAQQSASEGATPSAPASASTGAPAPGGTANLPVYFLGQDRGRPRLYREYHTLTVADGGAAAKVRAAVGAMLDGRTFDPDYASPWPRGASVRDARIEGGVVVVDLSGAGSNSIGGEYAQQAVQQLVWTASAQVPGSPAVRILLDGARVDDLWGHVNIGSDLRRAPAVDVLALVWVIDPQHGATVGRTVQVKVAGIVFEATAHVRIKRGGTVVHDRFVTLDKGPPQQGGYAYSVTLPAGTYTIEAFEISAADGSEQHLDDHEFTVR